MFYIFIVALVGIISMFAFLVAGKILGVILVAFITVFLVYRRAQKKNKEYLAATEEVSKEVMPDLYAIVKEKPNT